VTAYTCPSGHQSADADYCDTCGAPIAPSGPAAASIPSPTPAPASGTLPAPSEQACPNCGAEAAAGALFCEDCGYDFTTGALPPPSAALPGAGGMDSPTPSAGALSLDPPAGSAPTAPPVRRTERWVAEVWVDPDWYATQGAAQPCPSAGPPAVVPLTGRSLLIGRHSTSRSITPAIDCGADSGVSRRHAQLTTDGQRWWAEDLQSANGTFAGQTGAPLPTTPIMPGVRRELADDERIYLGAWTRIVIRKALPGE
jgi:hypothetical protein